MDNIHIKKPDDTSIVCLITGIALISFLLLNELMICSILSLAVFLGFLIWLFIKHFNFFLKAFPVVILFALLAIFGCFTLEFTAPWLYELQTDGSYIGATPLLIFAYWLLITSFFLIDKKLKPVDQANLPLTKNQKTQLRLYLNICCTAILIIYALMLISVLDKPAFLLQIDRFEYSQEINILPSIVKTSLWYTVAIPCLTLSRGDKRLGLITLVIYIWYMIWTGNKFGIFLWLLTILLFTFLPQILKKAETISKGKLFLIGSSILGILIVAAVAFTVYTYNSNVFVYLSERLSQQGQLWWKTFELSHLNLEHTLNYDIPLSVQDSFTGTSQIMYLCAPQDIVDAKLNSGSSYTEGGFAYVYYLFGIPGLIVFSVVLGFLFAVVTNALLFALNNSFPISSVFLTRFLNMTHQLKQNVALGGVFSLGTLVSLTFLIIVGLFVYRLYKHSKPTVL